MGVYLKLVNFEQAWRASKSPRLVVLNDLDNRTSDQKQQINDTLFTTNSADGVYSSIPSCQCGERTGRHRLGTLCSNCNTFVEEPIEEYIQPTVWIRQPRGVAPLVNPIVWYMLRKEFSIGGYGKFDTIAYLTNTSYRIEIAETDKMRRLFATLNEHGLNVRGYNHFIENFFKYMEVLFNCNVFKRKSDPPSPLYDLIMREGNNIFSSHIPIPNKSILIIEKTRYSTYIDTSLTTVIEAARIITSIDFEGSIPLNDRVRQNKTARVMMLLSHYYREYFREVLTPKEGHIRRTTISGRADYSARSVISSLSGEHRYDEIHIPWALSINWFRNHIMSKCLHRDMAPRQIFDFINKYNKEYHLVMDAILDELIGEAGQRGIPMALNRNPSLGKGSILTTFITHVKKDPEDITTSISPLICPLMNADYDGDSLNYMIYLDNKTREASMKLVPEANLFDLNSLHWPSGMAATPKPVASTIAAWLEDESPARQDVLEKMKQFQ